MANGTVNGVKIKELREGRDLTTAELADRVGATQAFISHIEVGFKQPSVILLKRIADFFGCTVDSLLVDPVTRPA